jgi:hypothetical protein
MTIPIGTTHEVGCKLQWRNMAWCAPGCRRLLRTWWPVAKSWRRTSPTRRPSPSGDTVKSGKFRQKAHYRVKISSRSWPPWWYQVGQKYRSIDQYIYMVVSWTQVRCWRHRFPKYTFVGGFGSGQGGSILKIITSTLKRGALEQLKVGPVMSIPWIMEDEYHVVFDCPYYNRLRSD